VEQDALDALDIARVRKFLSTRMGLLCGLGIMAMTGMLLLFALPPSYALAWIAGWMLLSARMPRLVHLLVSVFTLWYIWCFRLGLLNERPVANSCKAVVLAVALHAGAVGTVGILRIASTERHQLRMRRDGQGSSSRQVARDGSSKRVNRMADILAEQSVANFNQYELQILKDEGISPWSPEARDFLERNA
jgi:hypothetical protein